MHFVKRATRWQRISSWLDACCQREGGKNILNRPWKSNAIVVGVYVYMWVRNRTAVCSSRIVEWKLIQCWAMDASKKNGAWFEGAKIKIKIKLHNLHENSANLLCVCSSHMGTHPHWDYILNASIIIEWPKIMKEKSSDTKHNVDGRRINVAQFFHHQNSFVSVVVTLAVLAIRLPNAFFYMYL